MKKYLIAAAFVCQLTQANAATNSEIAAEKDAEWFFLVGQAKEHGGKEVTSRLSDFHVLMVNTPYDSYPSDDVYISFRRSLDGKTRLICASSCPMNDQGKYAMSNLAICHDWDTDSYFYFTRDDVSYPWVVSGLLPDDYLESAQPLMNVLAMISLDGSSILNTNNARKGRIGQFSASYLAHHPNAGRGRGNWGHHSNYAGNVRIGRFSASYLAHHPNAGRGRGNWGHH